MTPSSTVEARVQALMKLIVDFAVDAAPWLSAETPDKEDQEAYYTQREKLESAIRAEVSGKDAERLDFGDKALQIVAELVTLIQANGELTLHNHSGWMNKALCLVLDEQQAIPTTGAILDGEFSSIARRSIDLHEKAFMLLEDAIELALSESGLVPTPKTLVSNEQVDAAYKTLSRIITGDHAGFVVSAVIREALEQYAAIESTKDPI